MATTANLPALPEVTDLLASAQSVIKGFQSLLTNFNNGGVTETMLEALALALGSDASTYPNVQQKGAYELLAAAQAACYIISATGPALDNKAADVNVFRKPASYAKFAPGNVTLAIPAVSTTATVFAVNTVLVAESADPTVAPILFILSSPETIPAGSTSITNANTITAEAVGSAGNVEPGSLTSIVGGPYGATVTNSVRASGGTDTEGDDEPNGGLRARALAAIPNAQQGTVAALEDDALSYAGVITSLLIENLADDGVTFQPGRGQLLVDDGTGTLGENTALIAEIQTDFDSGLYRAASTTVHVVGATPLQVTNISFDLEYDAEYAASVQPYATLLSLVQNAMATYVNALGIGAPALLAELVALGMGVEGVTNIPLPSISINGIPSDLTPLFSQVVRIASPLYVTPTPIGLGA